MVCLYTRPLKVKYHTNRCSCGSFCALLYLAALIILPYVTVYALGGMWTKEQLVREQPDVLFRYEVLFEAQLSKLPSAEIVPLAWSTSQPLNDALRERLRPCQLRTYYEDDERDGKPDRLQLELTMPLDPDAGERLLSASLLVGVGVSFEREFRLELNASLHAQASHPLPGRAWHQTADLTLRSNKPQRSLDLGARDACPEPTWMFREPVQPNGQPATSETILAQYSRCNDTSLLEPQLPLWTAGIGKEFTTTLTIRIPPQQTTRRPGVVETLKLAAVQYIAFFLPIGYLLRLIYSALFELGVVSARVHHPVKEKRF